MFFKFNSLTNRISPSSQLAAYSPQGLSPYAGESAPIMFSSKTVQPQTSAEGISQMATSSARSMASSSSAAPPPTGNVGLVPNDPGYRKVMELQKMFCKDDGKLVWMKRGARDAIPYYGSMLLMFVGTGYAFYTIYKMSVPKKN